MIVEDGDTVYTETLEEALAEAFRDAPVGCVITLHEETCACDEDGEGCTCEVIEYVVGARA